MAVEVVLQARSLRARDAVEIGVEHGRVGGEGLEQVECGRAHRPHVTQGFQEASHEGRLTRPERPLQPNQIAGREPLGEGRPKGAGRRLVGEVDDLYFCLSGTHAVVLPPTVSRTISWPCTRSAPLPPPQRWWKSQVSGKWL